MGKHPLVNDYTIHADTVTATADVSAVAFVAPFAGSVTKASIIAPAAVTGHATETRTYTLVNKGADGLGTVVIATLALLAGVNLVAFDEKAFTLSAVAGATTVAEGDVLALVSTHTGVAGLADPGGLVSVSVSRTP